jgi:glycosyltransferase involved in cell wall biosynthesis
MLSPSADVMWVYHPPVTVGIPAWWIGLVKKIPFVYEIQDLWPETLPATGMVSSIRILKWISRLAGFIYRRAVGITVISPGFKRFLIAQGIPSSKIHVIPNWADEDIFRPAARDQQLGMEHGFVDHFNIIFGGNIGAAQALENVLETARIVHDLPSVQFIFIGEGVDKRKLQQRARVMGLSNVRFIDHQPMARMPYFFAFADVLLVHLKRDPFYEITIPGKTVAYLAMGKPILCTVPGDTADMVKSAGAGIVCQPENPTALAQAVRDLFTMNSERREALGRAGRQAFLNEYTREKLVDRYEELFREIVSHALKTKSSRKSFGL